MWLTIVCFLIIALCVAMNLTEGMWGNALKMFNAIFAAMIATNLFEPAATFISNTFPSITYFADFLGLWAVFCLAFGILDLATGFISRNTVRFKLPVEQAGSLRCRRVTPPRGHGEHFGSGHLGKVCGLASAPDERRE